MEKMRQISGVILMAEFSIASMFKEICATSVMEIPEQQQ
jgi:hypothetical protein